MVYRHFEDGTSDGTQDGTPCLEARLTVPDRGDWDTPRDVT